ncbi:MAG: GNAT family N-acetyltransferase [Vicingaceae bacterium]
MSYIIRRIAPTDNAHLATIIRNAFIEFDAPKTGTVYSDPTTDQLYELFKAQENATCFVAEENQEILGCCGIYPTEGLDDGYAELVKFYLAADARGRGIGKSLFEKSIEEARKFGYKYLYIESQPSFAKAVKLYENYGFTYLDHALGNSGHDNCDIWMIKKL